jgi:putative NADH-flavin reductase
MNIIVFGANGPTGKLLTQQALAEGHKVTAFTRHPEAFAIHHEHLRIVRGDVLHDPVVVEQAILGQDTVLSTLGVPFSRRPISIYSQGIANITHAMQKIGLRRLACVSSTAVDHHYDTQGGFFFEKVLTPLITQTLGRTLYTDMKRMETLVTNSDLDWTILRSSGLFETSTVTDYRVTDGYISGRFTSRRDLADCLLKQATSDQLVHKAVAVATFAEQPSIVQLIMREAFQRRPVTA